MFGVISALLYHRPSEGVDTNLLHVVLGEDPRVVFVDVLVLPVLQK